MLLCPQALSAAGGLELLGESFPVPLTEALAFAVPGALLAWDLQAAQTKVCYVDGQAFASAGALAVPRGLLAWDLQAAQTKVCKCEWVGTRSCACAFAVLRGLLA